MKLSKKILAALSFIAFMPVSAFASADTPMFSAIDTTLMTIEQDVTGFWAHTIVVIMFVVGGLGLMFGEGGGAVKKLGGYVMGGAIALGAGSLVTQVFAGTGAFIH